MPLDTLIALKEIAATNRWSALAPEIVLGVAALALLALEFVLPKRALALAAPRAALLGFAASLA